MNWRRYFGVWAYSLIIIALVAALVAVLMWLNTISIWWAIGGVIATVINIIAAIYATESSDR